MKIPKRVLKKAHEACFQNKRILEKSKKCACFCCNFFQVSVIYCIQASRFRFFHFSKSLSGQV